jgi:hypothetical protein
MGGLASVFKEEQIIWIVIRMENDRQRIIIHVADEPLNVPAF